MSDQRITQLPALPAASAAATDVLPVADVSASQTKKITVKDLVDAGLDLVDASSIDLDKLDQSSTTKIGATALATGAVTAAKLAADSSIAVDTTAPGSDNFEGRGYYNSSTGALQVYSGGAFANVNATIANDAVTTAKILDGAVTTAKCDSLGTAALANGAVTYAKIQDVSATDKLLGRSSAGSGDVEEITCTAAGRALLDDADATAQRATLGLGTLATQSGTFSGTHSGTSSGTNTGDQTITLTGDVTGSGTGSFAATIASAAVTEAKLASNAVSTAKIVDDAVTAGKLADDSAAIVSNVTPSGSGAFRGQQWFNTATGFEYTWDGTAWQRQSALNELTITETSPLAFAVTYPDDFSVAVDVTLDTQAANTVWAGPTTGASTTPAFRALVPADLPDATGSTKGIIQPGTGLAVSSGTLNHSNTATAGTYSKVTIDAQGHVVTGTAIEASDIPNLDASKITSGEFATARIANSAITGAKVADYAVSLFGESLPTAEHIGQFFFNPLTRDLYLWDGNVYQPVGISAGEIILAGTYDANTNLLDSVTAEGTAAGFTSGAALPAAATINNRYYVVVSQTGTGTAPAPAVALEPPDILLSNGTSYVLIETSETIVAQIASNVGFTPTGNIASTNVQSAIAELDNEKLPKAGGTVTGELLIGTAGSFVFEGSTANDYETTLTVTDPTADRTITLPNSTGTVALTSDLNDGTY